MNSLQHMLICTHVNIVIPSISLRSTLNYLFIKLFKSSPHIFVTIQFSVLKTVTVVSMVVRRPLAIPGKIGHYCKSFLSPLGTM